MKPTKGTEWWYLCARTEGASATACIRAGAYPLAAMHATKAKTYWLMVEWEHE